MMNRNRTLLGIPIATALVVGLMGCSEEPPVVVAPVKPSGPVTPPPPPAPAVKTVAQLMGELGIDDRVMMLEGWAPQSTEERRVVLEFFDAFARGDAASLRMMLPPLEQAELRALEESGQWSETLDGLYSISVESGVSPDGDRCVLALFDVEGGAVPQPQLWAYRQESGGWIFEAQPCPPGIMSKLSGNDQITAWHEILQKEIELASKPEEDVSVDPVDLDSNTSSGGDGISPGPGTSPSPGGPGGMPRRRPTPPPRRPPGPGGTP